MRVIAVRDGYYEHRRVYAGEVFDLKDPKHFSDEKAKPHPGWMKPYSGKKAALEMPDFDKEVEHDSERQPSKMESSDVKMHKKQKDRAQDQDVL